MAWLLNRWSQVVIWKGCRVGLSTTCLANKQQLIHLYCPPPSACHTDYLSDNKADIDAIRFVSDTNPTTINVCSCGRAGSADGNG